MTLGTDTVFRRWTLLWMALRFGVYTVLTLGIYRFWAKTRLRRFYWSSVRPGGHPVEYVGEPLEKLLGFLIAVVILAFYIGVINLILVFLSFSLFADNWVGYVASFIGVIPLWFYARYRARRYVLGRTRWRGIRFGVDPGAWGYAWRAILHWTVTILTAGLLWPRMTFWLEKYRADRTWYGSAQVVQGGRWTMLFGPATPLLIIVLSGAIAGALFWYELINEVQASNIGLMCLIAFPAAIVNYRVKAFRKLTETKTAAGSTFLLPITTARVLWIYVVGYLVTILLTGLVASLPFLAMTSYFASLGLDLGIDDLEVLASPSFGVQAIAILFYFLTFVVWGTLRHAFVTLPLWRYYASKLEILQAENLDTVRQRARDDNQQAEGFAEALDLGAAI